MGTGRRLSAGNETRVPVSASLNLAAVREIVAREMNADSPLARALMLLADDAQEHLAISTRIAENHVKTIDETNERLTLLRASILELAEVGDLTRQGLLVLKDECDEFQDQVMESVNSVIDHVADSAA